MGKRSGSKPKTEHQRQLDLALRRAKRLEKLGFEFDYAALSRARTATLESLKGYRLMQSRFVKQVQMKQLVPDDRGGVKEAKGVVLTGAEYAKFHRAHKSEAIVLAKLGKKARPISSFYAGSRHAFEKLLEGTRKRGSLQYHKDRDRLMIENFMKTLDAMKFSDQSEHPVAEAVKKKMREMGTEWTLEKLRAGMRGETEMVSTMIFDSKFGRVVSRSSSLLRVFEIPIESVQWEEEDDGEEEYYE